MRAALDLRLYLVTDRALCGSVGVEDTVRAAVRGGATVVQLRDPSATDDEFVACGRMLAEALAGTGVPLIINDRAHLAREIGADGVHVGQHDLPAVDARALVGPDAWLGLSVQTLGHVDAARALPPGTVDHLGVGPVWPQTTKPDAAEAGGLPVLASIAAASPWPCVAIGGISLDRVPAARAAGAAGVAVVSAICGQQDPERAARELRAAWDDAGVPA